MNENVRSPKKANVAIVAVSMIFLVFVFIFSKCSASNEGPTSTKPSNSGASSHITNSTHNSTTDTTSKEDNNVKVPTPTIPAPKNINLVNGVLFFDPVENASGYKIKIRDLYETIIDKPMVNLTKVLESLTGEISISISTVVDKNIGETAVYSYFRIVPGLYRTGSDYTILISDWDKLIKNGIVNSYGSVLPGQEKNLAGDLVLPDTLTSIPYRAYSNTNISGIFISNAVTEIGRFSFDGCSKLQFVIFEEESIITKIGEHAFSSCDNLQDIKIPKSIIDVGDKAFSECSMLNSVIFEENNRLVNMGRHVFYECGNLSVVDFGNNNSLLEIKDFAFYNCSSLEFVKIPDSVVSIGLASFSGCISMQSVSFGDNSKLFYIGDNAFYGCMTLKEITLPDITKNATKDVTKHMGLAVFDLCWSLEKITMLATTPPVLDSLWEMYELNVDILVPSENVEAYRTAFGWNKYKNLIREK